MSRGLKENGLFLSCFLPSCSVSITFSSLSWIRGYSWTDGKKGRKAFTKSGL